MRERNTAGEKTGRSEDSPQGKPLVATMLTTLHLLVLWFVVYTSAFQQPHQKSVPKFTPCLSSVPSGTGFGTKKRNAAVIEKREVQNADHVEPVFSKPSRANGDDRADPPLNDSINADDMIRNSQLFKRDRERRLAELQAKVQRIATEEQLERELPQSGTVPEAVANRMLRRIAVFFGIPVLAGITVFIASYIYAKHYDQQLPPTVLAYATQLPFGLGLAGITYGILSASWDKEPGSWLGLAEFKTNLSRIKEGSQRGKEKEKLLAEIEAEKKLLGITN